MTKKYLNFLFFPEIEYSMPLKKDPKRQSAELDSKFVDSDTTALNDQENNGEDDDEAQDALLESLGIENSEILKINHSQVRHTSNIPRVCRFVVSNLSQMFCFRRE